MISIGFSEGLPITDIYIEVGDVIYGPHTVRHEVFKKMTECRAH